MSKWILMAAMVGLLGCNPATGPGFGGGGTSTGDDTGKDDTGQDDMDCPPTFGDINAEIDDYPGVGWVAEVEAPFVEGTCSIADGDLYIGLDGGATEEGPFPIGFDDEDAWVDDYDEGAGTGTLFFAFEVGSSTDQVTFTMWVSFPDGSASERVEVTVDG